MVEERPAGSHATSQTRPQAGAAGVGSGTLLVLLAQNLSDSNPAKSWLLILARQPWRLRTCGQGCASPLTIALPSGRSGFSSCRRRKPCKALVMTRMLQTSTRVSFAANWNRFSEITLAAPLCDFAPDLMNMGTPGNEGTFLGRDRSRIVTHQSTRGGPLRAVGPSDARRFHGGGSRRLPVP